MDVVTLSPSHLAAAAELFAAGVGRLRAAVPALPDTLTDPTAAAALQRPLLTSGRAVAAMDGGSLVGFLAWHVVEGFRGTGRTGAYVPVHGHGAVPHRVAEVYPALHRAAAQQWDAAGCEVHCVTVLADQQDTIHRWFVNGFGMFLHDGIRATAAPLAQRPLPSGVRLRPAVAADADALAALDTEHRAHYSAPPVNMAPQPGDTAAEIAALVARPPAGYWLAEVDGRPEAFLRFEPTADGATAIVHSPTTIALSGAFTRPALRGRGIAAALLQAALADYAGRGFTRMSVDYETVNPTALAFWPARFDTVAVSLMRVPEWVPR